MDIQKVGKIACLIFASIASLIFIMGTTIAEANINQMKLYKKAFPGSKPKCLACHTDKMPKKADGQNDLNIYGKKIAEMAEEPTEETYKEVGSVEDFEASGEAEKDTE